MTLVLERNGRRPGEPIPFGPGSTPSALGLVPTPLGNGGQPIPVGIDLLPGGQRPPGLGYVGHRGMVVTPGEDKKRDWLTVLERETA